MNNSLFSAFLEVIKMLNSRINDLNLILSISIGAFAFMFAIVIMQNFSLSKRLLIIEKMFINEKEEIKDQSSQDDSIKS